MVYDDPEWKHKNIYLGAHRNKKCTFFGPKVKNAIINNNNVFPFCTITVHLVSELWIVWLFTSIAVPYVQKVGVGLELMFV